MAGWAGWLGWLGWDRAEPGPGPGPGLDPGLGPVRALPPEPPPKKKQKLWEVFVEECPHSSRV